MERVGLGQANARYFLFHAGIGFDAAVVRRVEKLAPLKRYSGPALFVMATLITWAKGYDRRRPAVLRRAGETVIDDGYFAVCLNTDPYTFLGSRPLHLAPGTLGRRCLSLVTFELCLGTMLPVLASALGEGDKIGRHRHVSVITGVNAATVKGHRPVPYQLDGDYVGEADQIELSWAAGGIVGPRPGSHAGPSPGSRDRGPSTEPAAADGAWSRRSLNSFLEKVRRCPLRGHKGGYTASTHDFYLFILVD